MPSEIIGAAPDLTPPTPFPEGKGVFKLAHCSVIRSQARTLALLVAADGVAAARRRRGVVLALQVAFHCIVADRGVRGVVLHLQIAAAPDSKPVVFRAATATSEAVTRKLSAGKTDSWDLLVQQTYEVHNP